MRIMSARTQRCSRYAAPVFAGRLVSQLLSSHDSTRTIIVANW